MFSYWAKPADGLDLSRRLNDHIAEVVRAHPARFAGLGHDPIAGSGAGGARAGALRARARSARRANRQRTSMRIAHVPNELTQSRRSLARSGLAGRGRIGGGDFRSSLGHGRQGTHAEILAPLARRYAGRDFARHLLDDVRRSLRAFSEICASPSRTAAAPSRSRSAASNTALTFDPTWSRSTTRSIRAATSRDRRARRGTPARFYVDSLVHDPDALRLLLKLFGVERIALGSDYPFPLGEAHPGELIESMPDFSPEEKTRLLSGSAREFLALH